jgi:deoxyribodipyrimidine photo-lyase
VGSAPVIFWFRRDLRLRDHPALADAAARGPVVALFVNDPVLRQPAGAPRLAFLSDALGSLSESMDGRLVIRSGDPVDVLGSLATETGAGAIFATDDHGPYGRRRDDRVGQELAARGISVHYRDSNYAIAPDRVKTGSGTPYRVFTPFFRAWKSLGWVEPTGRVAADFVADIASEPIPPATRPVVPLPHAGEFAAHARLDRFLSGAVERYDRDRNDPGIDGTSKLGVYLKWGTLHPRQILARLGGSPGEEVFRAEIAWREFYADVLFQAPESARTSYAAKMAAMEVDDGPLAEARFAAWCEGRTGYPIVDAGMRQLLTEGWMHNRVRMIAASFLVKDLHLDWTWGARHFMRHLIDGDLASNQHGWQWVAGTGTDASPYFRIFNPVSQGKKFDPTGRYVRRYVPELADLDATEVHEPWLAGLRTPAGYPSPIVDHATERVESLARYDRLKAGWQ